MRSRITGLILIILSISFSIVYAYSLLVWILAYGRAPYAWTWWVILIPVLIIVSFAIFFIAWIGWVMIKPKPKTIKELMDSHEK